MDNYKNKRETIRLRVYTEDVNDRGKRVGLRLDRRHGERKIVPKRSQGPEYPVNSQE